MEPASPTEPAPLPEPQIAYLLHRFSAAAIGFQEKIKPVFDGYERPCGVPAIFEAAAFLLYLFTNDVIQAETPDPALRKACEYAAGWTTQPFCDLLPEATLIGLLQERSDAYAEITASWDPEAEPEADFLSIHSGVLLDYLLSHQSETHLLPDRMHKPDWDRAGAQGFVIFGRLTIVLTDAAFDTILPFLLLENYCQTVGGLARVTVPQMETLAALAVENAQKAREHYQISPLETVNSPEINPLPISNG